MVSSPSPPSAPDPTTTANAQTASNQATALYQAGLNDVNQNTPLGSINYNINPTGNGGTGATYDTQAYEQAMQAWQKAQSAPSSLTPAGFAPPRGSGYWAATGQTPPSGSAGAEPTLSEFQTSPGTSATPSTTSTVTLNPLVQNALNEYLQTAGNEGAIAQGYQGQVANTLSQPLQLPQVPQANMQMLNNTVAQEEAALQPEINMQTEQNQATLANEGLTPGSQAYNNQMYTFNAGQNNLQQQIASNAEQQMAQNYGNLLAGTQQQATEAQTAYQEPLNELSALQSGTQVGTPQFNAAPAANVSPTNVAGITNQAYQNQLGGYNAQVGQSNQLMGGLFGLGGNALTAYALM